MRTMWCWRCQQELPMLDDQEFARIAAIFEACRAALPTLNDDKPVTSEKVYAHFAPVRAAYTEMTGYGDLHHHAILHHKISTFGPPCATCGKPLRTPKAKMCAACGAAVDR